MIRDYLLKALDEEQQEEVELRLLGDAEFAEEVRRVRTELFDEYAAARLPAESRELFERRHLATGEGREKLLFTKDLLAYAERRRATSLSVSRLREFFRLRRLYLALPVAAVLLLAFSLIIWKIVERRGPDVGAREVSARRAALEGELARLNSEGQIVAAANAPAVSVTLARHLVRGGGEAQKVSLGGGVKILELRLPLEPGRQQFYRATLLTSEDEELAAVGGLRADNDDGMRVLSVLLPADKLPDGDYQLKLEGVEAGGETTPLGLYQFRLTRRQ